MAQNRDGSYLFRSGKRYKPLKDTGTFLSLFPAFSPLLDAFTDRQIPLDGLGNFYSAVFDLNETAPSDQKLIDLEIQNLVTIHFPPDKFPSRNVYDVGRWRARHNRDVCRRIKGQSPIYRTPLECWEEKNALENSPPDSPPVFSNEFRPLLRRVYTGPVPVEEIRRRFQEKPQSYYIPDIWVSPDEKPILYRMEAKSGGKGGGKPRPIECLSSLMPLSHSAYRRKDGSYRYFPETLRPPMDTDRLLAEFARFIPDDETPKPRAPIFRPPTVDDLRDELF